jgi:hypothetical protein
MIQSRIESGLGERKGIEQTPGMLQRLFTGKGVR